MGFFYKSDKILAADFLAEKNVIGLPQLKFRPFGNTVW
jgi:hypothetical protein